MAGLRHEFPLDGLLKVAGLARSTFYYQCKASQKADKHAQLKARIRSVFEQHKGRYGYRRITSAIRHLGTRVNHKTVQRLMQLMKLKSLVRPKKFRAFRGRWDVLRRTYCKDSSMPTRQIRSGSPISPNSGWASESSICRRC